MVQDGPDALVDSLLDLLEKKGSERYGDENVSQLDHALQCALLAERDGAPDALVTASLFHDIGHLLGKGDEGLAAQGIDARHEESGALYLGRYFTPAVSEPVRLHVAAKRYLCQEEDGYWDMLSDGSKRSLEVQGGSMDEREAKQFAAQAHGADAARLRRWDDLAKDPGLTSPPAVHFRPAVLASLQTRG